MSSNTRVSRAVLNAQADALALMLDGGSLCIYDGVQPVDADEEVSSQTMLAELGFGSPAFKPAVDGELVSNPMTPDKDAAATGTPSWFRCYSSDGSAILDGSAGTSGCNLNLSTEKIQQHGLVSLEGFVHKVSA
jgi:hypothetical protein